MFGGFRFRRNKEKQLYLCDQCGAGFDNQDLLSKHQSSIHVVAKKEPIIRQKFRCGSCGAEFGTEEAFKEHMSSAHESAPTAQQH